MASNGRRSTRRATREDEAEDVDDAEEDESEEDADDDDDDDDDDFESKKRKRSSARVGGGSAFVARERRRSTRHASKPRKRYVESEDEDEEQDEDQDGEEKTRSTRTAKRGAGDDDDEFLEEDATDEEDDFIEDDSDDEPVRRSTRTRGRVNRLSPTFRVRSKDKDSGDEEPEFDDEETTDDERIGVGNKTYPKRERGPPPERFVPQAHEQREREEREDDGKRRPGLFDRRGNTWKDDRPKRSSRERRRQTSGRWVDDSEDSDDGDFNLGIGAADAFKAPAPYPVAGAAGPTSTAPPTGPDASAEITPVTVDPSLSFSSVGGLDKYVDALKEMVFLPLLYPEVFARFKMSPPRGVLLYGAPGTGKTLIARALAASCSRAGSEVAFFMRKGADVLSKWVGESERQLRLLFEEAQKRQPAIIFFDELDGLAPVRSSKTDQIHNSLVATLLALMDGLDNRGRVVVLGATNRVDSIDGALRRPGRFDRELAFPLPGVRARGEILRIHTREWEQRPSDELIDDLAAKCVGYCGADLKALCTEAAVHALRRRYPQIYESDERLNIDPKQVIPSRADFRAALAAIVPASHRAARTHARPLTPLQKPLLESMLEQCLHGIRQTFPPAAFITLDGDGEAVGVNSGAREFVVDETAEDEDEDIIAQASASDKAAGALPSESAATAALEFMRRPPCQRTALCIHGVETSGYNQLTSALLHALEQFPVHAIGMPSLLGDSGRSPEEALVTAVTEARRAAPSILYLPELRLWWESSTPTLRAALTTLLRDIPTDLPVMLITTADVNDIEDLDDDLRASFSSVRWKPMAMPRTYDEDSLTRFFHPLLDAAFNIAQKKDESAARGELAEGKTPSSARRREVLARAPRPDGGDIGSAKSSAQKVSQATVAAEEHLLRQQRMFLRDVVTRLLYKKNWAIFAAPINDEELPGYSQRVSDPMDLSTLLWKVDSEKYDTVDAFLCDVQFITTSAKQYWGEHTDDVDGRQMLSKAHALVDTIAQMVTVLDPQLVSRCQEIHKSRNDRRAGAAAVTTTDSAGDKHVTTRIAEGVAPKGAPIWQNADYVKDPEKLARELKKKAREEAAAATGECDVDASPMDEDVVVRDENAVDPGVRSRESTPCGKCGPPAKDSAELEEMKKKTVRRFVDLAKGAHDFTALEAIAGDIARVSKRVANTSASLRVETLAKALSDMQADALA